MITGTTLKNRLLCTQKIFYSQYTFLKNFSISTYSIMSLIRLTIKQIDRLNINNINCFIFTICLIIIIKKMQVGGEINQTQYLQNSQQNYLDNKYPDEAQITNLTQINTIITQPIQQSPKNTLYITNINFWNERNSIYLMSIILMILIIIMFLLVVSQQADNQVRSKNLQNLITTQIKNSNQLDNQVNKQMSQIKKNLLVRSTQIKLLENKIVWQIQKIEQGQLKIKGGIDKSINNNKKLTNLLKNSKKTFQKDFTKINKQIKQIQQKSAYQKFSLLFQTKFVNYQYNFDIPKIVWMYNQVADNYLKQLYLDNMKYYANRSGYLIKLVNQSNFHEYLPVKIVNQIRQIISLIKNKLKGQKINQIIKKIILLNLLNQNGGIIINRPIAMTEDFQWIRNIIRNKFVNRGNRPLMPQIIAFYQPIYSSKRTKFNLIPFPGMEQSDKFVIQIPFIDDSFFASIKKAQIIGDLLQKMYSFLKDPILYHTSRKMNILNKIINGSAYDNIVTITFEIILRDLQKQLNSAMKNSYKFFAFDYFGFNLINRNYGPSKLDRIFPIDDYWAFNFKDTYNNQMYYHLTHVSQEEMLTYFGPIRYFTRFHKQNQINNYLEKSRSGEKQFQIFKGSLIQQLFFSRKTESFIGQNPENSFINEANQQWNELPKLIWVFGSTFDGYLSIFQQISYNNIKINAKSSGFKVILITKSNIGMYLSRKVQSKISSIVSESIITNKIKLYRDLYRLAILYNYGGVYLQTSTIPLQNFDWILNITKFPSQYIFNRFGKNPKVLMASQTFSYQPEKWNYSNINNQNNQRKIKTRWFEALEDSFIIAQKNSRLIKQWFDVMAYYLTQPYIKFENFLTKNNINPQHRLTSSLDQQLFSLDVIRGIIGRRQNRLMQQSDSKWINAPQYYKLWTINNFISSHKMKSNFNFEKNLKEFKQFIMQYPSEKVKDLIGNLGHMITFSKNQIINLNVFLKQHSDKNFTTDAHPESIFMKYVWNEKYRVNGKNEELQLLVME